MSQFTVVTEKSRLGRWVRSQKAAEKIAERWARQLPGRAVRVLDDKGVCVFSQAST